MEDQSLCSSRRLQNLPPSVTVEPPPPPQRQRLDTDGSFKPIGVSEVLGEPKLRINQEETTVVDIEYLQAYEFARNFNPPLTYLNDIVIVEVFPFNSPVIGVPLRKVISRSGEGISTPNSSILVGGVPPPPVGTSIPSASTAPLSPSSQVVQPPTPSNVVDQSSGVVTRVPCALFSSPSFMHTTQSGPSRSSLFV